jgi:putative Mg2+ transporter-C (MgtC) family protein
MHQFAMFLAQPGGHPFSFNDLEQILIASDVAKRLLLASVLGGAIGLEREYHKKPSGIRTNLLICLACAFFTLLSAVLAGEANPDKGRVASNIVQGVGFLGAGLILHNRSRIRGLTSAASVFVVASIGMACGAGLYVPATLAAFIALVVLEIVGFMETRLNLKNIPVIYEARGHDEVLMTQAILRAMDEVHERFSITEQDMIGDLHRVTFSLDTKLRNHEKLKARLREESDIEKFQAYREQEDD